MHWHSWQSFYLDNYNGPFALTFLITLLSWQLQCPLCSDFDSAKYVLLRNRLKNNHGSWSFQCWIMLTNLLNIVHNDPQPFNGPYSLKIIKTKIKKLYSSWEPKPMEDKSWGIGVTGKYVAMNGWIELLTSLESQSSITFIGTSNLPEIPKWRICRYS